VTHEWSVTRRDPVEDSIFGVFSLGSVLSCYSLERLAVAIPNGRYQVQLTESARAKSGSLWTPDPHFRLPILLNVPGRDGIRIHAANYARELLGCIAAGADIDGDMLQHSRPSVTRIINELLDAQVNHEDVWLTLQNGDTSVPLWTKGPQP
jgi:hypothetical protein